MSCLGNFDLKFIDLGLQYSRLKEKIDARIKQVLEHGIYIMGPEVELLEAELKSYVGVRNAVTCANGTDALELALMAINVGPGDAVFCPTFTFFATAEVIAHLGATPVFVDSNQHTFNICPDDLKRRINDVNKAGMMNPKAVISVDLFGLPADYSALKKICKKYDLKLIEDAAQGFGGSIGDKQAGSFGDISTTSFFPAKPLGCYGDGGALFTNNDEYAELIRSYRVHGKGSDKYDNVRIGLNSRLDTIQAAILLEKLAAFPEELLARNQIASNYTLNLKDTFSTPRVPSDYGSSWAQYTLKSNFRDEFVQQLNELGITTMVYYSKCMHQQPAFRYLGYLNKDFPVASELSKKVFSLPMHPYLSQSIQKEVIKSLLDLN